MSYIEKRNQIDLLLQKINSHGELSVDVKKKINYKFRLDWNYYSNSMEGNTLTMDETRSVMVGNLTVGGKPIKDVLEIKGHDQVISEIINIGKGEVRLSEKRIKEIHKGIMHEEDESKKGKIGVWKTDPNYLFNYKNERFDFVLPPEVPERMHELLNKTNAAIDAIQQNKKDAPHPVDVALQFHLDYVIIHPFYDGNGRTARILTNLLLISFGFPPFWVKTNERGVYNQYIGDIQGYGGNPDLFFEFATDMILRSQQLVLDAISGKAIHEPGDLEKKLDLLKQRLENSKDDEVKTERTNEITHQIFNSDMRPMFQEIINRLQQFEPLFKSRNIDLTIEGRVHSNLKELLEKETDFHDFKNGIHNMNLSYGLNGFRKVGVKTFNVSASLKITFHQFVYEISTQDNKTIISKLYHQHLSDDEMQTVSDVLGNMLLENIEATLERITNDKK